MCFCYLMLWALKLLLGSPILLVSYSVASQTCMKMLIVALSWHDREHFLFICLNAILIVKRFKTSDRKFLVLLQPSMTLVSKIFGNHFCEKVFFRSKKAETWMRSKWLHVSKQAMPVPGIVTRKKWKRSWFKRKS